MNFEIDENPEKLIIPLDISKAIYEGWNADLVILDKPDQVYGKALHGKGSINFKNQNIYEGEIYNGMMHGKGKFIWANGVEYEGDFNYNAIEGQGVYKWPDQSIYEGSVKASFRDGFGKFISPNQEAVYEGEWKNGLRQGKGKITFESGAIYEGEFDKGYKHGNGKMLYPSGNYYEGEWREDKKCGYGTMNWLSAKEKYYGNWANNLQNGFGVHIWLEQKGEGKLLRNRYEGEWKDGERHGYGTFYYANGSKYEGEWKNNLKEGYAVFTEDNGNIVQGMFKADKLVKEQSKKVEDEVSNKELDDSQSDIAGPSESPQKIQQDTIKGNKNGQIKGKQEKDNKKNTAANQKLNKIQSKQGKNLEQTQQQQLQQQKTLETQSQFKRNKEIEVNPFSYLIDLNDLTINVQDDIERIHRDTQNMLLRHNTSIKQWYKFYSNKYENGIGEDAFAMDLQTFWKFMKESKVCDGNMTLSALNRLFYQGAKNEYNMKTQDGEVNNQIEVLKKIGRNISLQELKDLKILTLALDTSNQLQQQDTKLDWTNLDKLEQEEEDQALYNNRFQNIHDGNRVILFRHFVELLVRASFLKYGNINELHRSVEKLIEQKLKPIYERKATSMTNSRPNKSISSEKSLILQDSMSKYWIENQKNILQQIYDKMAKSNRNKKFGFEDNTITFKQIAKLLQDSDHISNEQQDKNKLILMYEKQYDKDQTVGYVEQLHKEEVANLKKRKNKKGNQTASQTSQVVLSQNYERLKAEKQTKMYESELLFHEFCDIVIQFLFKFEKELQQGKDQEVSKKLKEHLLRLLNSSKPFKKVQPGAIRHWPKTQKDNAKDQLAQQRLREQKEAEEKKKKEMERRRENRERARMQLEDINIPTENEEESDDEDY